MIERRIGTYIECRYTEESRLKLYAYAQTLNVPHLLAPSKYHTTVLYSREPIWKIHGTLETRPGWKFYAIELHFFEGSKQVGIGLGDGAGIHVSNGNGNGNGNGEKILAVILNAPQLTRMNEELILAGGTHDFDDYRPHVTLSYFCPVFDLTTVPRFEGALEVEEVQAVPFNLNWKTT